MRDMRGVVLLICVLLLVGASYETFWNFPELPPPSQYGNFLLNRTSEKAGQKPAIFSHWVHRTRYTCRVCHFELDFAMKTGDTEITEEANLNGEYCGACHNGDIAFGHTEDNCDKCHNGNIDYGREKFEELSKRLPKTPFGDKINWSRAIRKGLISPKQSVFDDNYESIPFKKTLVLQPEWSMADDAVSVFRHKTHIRWLDCADCHPDIFNIKEKGTKHFRMKYILERKFCGACHYNVALPVQFCRPCHPKIKTKKY
ncbi:MAG: hypothetical protein JSV21_05655 [Nitrospirota bacterium]|nr:MAG: hypothetical protein JSV21_05655 [Nitrospirota bacterium]